MAGHFFDSSALVKLYHPEAGTPAVDQIINAAGNLVRIFRLTVAELTSAFAIKVRTQSITREDVEQFLRQFRRDSAIGKLEIFSAAESEFAMGELLVERYVFDSRLRAMDALQLAAPLELRNQKLVDHFVAADSSLRFSDFRDVVVPSRICFRGHGNRLAAYSALQRDRASDRGMDHAAMLRVLGIRSPLPLRHPRPRLDLLFWFGHSTERFRPPCSENARPSA